MLYYLDFVISITRFSIFFYAIILGIIVYFSLALIIHNFTKYKVLKELFEVISHWRPVDSQTIRGLWIKWEIITKYVIVEIASVAQGKVELKLNYSMGPIRKKPDKK